MKTLPPGFKMSIFGWYLFSIDCYACGDCRSLPPRHDEQFEMYCEKCPNDSCSITVKRISITQLIPEIEYLLPHKWLILVSAYQQLYCWWPLLCSHRWFLFIDRKCRGDNSFAWFLTFLQSCPTCSLHHLDRCINDRQISSRGCHFR